MRIYDRLHDLRRYTGYRYVLRKPLVHVPVRYVPQREVRVKPSKLRVRSCKHRRLRRQRRHDGRFCDANRVMKHHAVGNKHFSGNAYVVRPFFGFVLYFFYFFYCAQGYVAFGKFFQRFSICLAWRLYSLPVRLYCYSLLIAFYRKAFWYWGKFSCFQFLKRLCHEKFAVKDEERMPRRDSHFPAVLQHYPVEMLRRSVLADPERLRLFYADKIRCEYLRAVHFGKKAIIAFFYLCLIFFKYAFYKVSYLYILPRRKRYFRVAVIAFHRHRFMHGYLVVLSHLVKFIYAYHGLVREYQRACLKQPAAHYLVFTHGRRVVYNHPVCNKRMLAFNRKVVDVIFAFNRFHGLYLVPVYVRFLQYS